MKELLQAKTNLKKRIAEVRQELSGYEAKREELLSLEVDLSAVLDAVTAAETAQRKAACIAAEAKKPKTKKEWVPSR